MIFGGYIMDMQWYNGDNNGNVMGISGGRKICGSGDRL